MKKYGLIALVLLFSAFVASAQTKQLTVTGKITKARQYNEQFAFTVHDTVLVLITNMKAGQIKGFQVNKAYKDILVKQKGKYVVNPKYENHTYKIDYYVNGKGWKCIKALTLVK